MNDKPFMTIKDACAATGLSKFFLREGCKTGAVPHIKSGNKYFVNVPALLNSFDAKSRGL